MSTNKPAAEYRSFESQYPALGWFLGRCFRANYDMTDAESVSEAVSVECPEDLAKVIAEAEAVLHLPLEAFPWDGISDAANIHFERAEDAREWAGNLVALIHSALRGPSRAAV